MGLYGNQECLYNENHPNPYYLTKCNNPEVEKDTVEASECNNCKKALLPDYSDNDSLENLVACLEGKKKEMVKDYALRILRGTIQPWEVD